MPLPVPQYDPNAFSNAFQQARGNRLQDVYMQRDAEATQYNRQRQAAADKRVADKDAQDLNDREREILATVYAPLAQQAVQSGDVRGFYASALANPQVRAQFQRDGFDMDEADLQDPDFEAQIAGLAKMGAQPKPAVKWEDVQGPRGSRLQRNPETGELRQVVGPDNSQPAASTGDKFRNLTEQELSQYGLPPGTSAQLNERTGKVDVISRRDNTGALSQKDMTTAKQKLNTVKIARKQLENIRAAFGAIQNSSSAGPALQGRLPTPKGKAFDAAVDQMRSTLTALTRVPGVGAMSDYETRLDQAKFPDRKNYENVTAQQIDAIAQLLDGIESGYTDLMGGGGQQAPAQPAASGGWTIKRVE